MPKVVIENETEKVEEILEIDFENEVLEKKPKKKTIKKTKKKEEKITMEKEKQISDLPGVGPATVEKLLTAGIDNLMSIAVCPISKLVDTAGVSEAVARKMIVASRDMLDMGFVDATTVLKKRDEVIKITTGSENFDNLLKEAKMLNENGEYVENTKRGGFETGGIVEVFGEFGSGKTQIGHQLAVNVQLPPEQGGCNGKVIYIDTENTFRPERIIEMATGAGLDPEEVLKNIKVAKAYNSDHQMLLVEKAEELLKTGEYKVLIVDSLMAHFRSEFMGRGTLSERQQKLNKAMSTMNKLADLYNVLVFVTNQVMSKPNVMFGDPTQAVGGHVVAHASNFRLYLRKGKAGSRVAKLIDSPNLPEGDCTYWVTMSGIRDKEEK